jgi:uncharacterized coiled-coil protein SlyX
MRLSFLCFLSLLWPTAGNAAEPDDQSRITQLEALLNGQQQRIAALEQQVAAQVGDDQARIDAMRQQIREILSEQEFRESLMPPVAQAGYDNGFFIRSTDDKFLMKLHGRVQFRWTYYNAQHRNHYLLPRYERDDRTGLDLRRVRFAIDGHLHTPDLTYLLEFDWDSPHSYTGGLTYAWANYRFVDEFQIRVGLMESASTRAGFHSSASMQFPTYPLNQLFFGTGYDMGIRFWGQAFNKRWEYWLDVANGIQAPYNLVITPDPPQLDDNPAIMFRTVWHAMGQMIPNDFAGWADLEYHECPALDFGFHYAFQHNTGDDSGSRVFFGRNSILLGGFGVTRSLGLQTNQFGLDSAFKLRGFSIAGEYDVQILDPISAGHTPFTPLWLLTGQDSTTTINGGYVQAGYFLPIPGWERKLEVVGRVGGVQTNAGEHEGTWYYDGGVNYYFKGNKVKLQADVEKISETPMSSRSWIANPNDEALIFRVQLQVAF